MCVELRRESNVTLDSAVTDFKEMLHFYGIRRRCTFWSRMSFVKQFFLLFFLFSSLQFYFFLFPLFIPSFLPSSHPPSYPSSLSLLSFISSYPPLIHSPRSISVTKPKGLSPHFPRQRSPVKLWNASAQFLYTRKLEFSFLELDRGGLVIWWCDKMVGNWRI